MRKKKPIRQAYLKRLDDICKHILQTDPTVPLIDRADKRAHREVNFYTNSRTVTYNDGLFMDLKDNYKWNRSKHFKVNKFAIQNLLAIGGGALPLLRNCLKYQRAGGSTQDLINYIGTYDTNTSSPIHTWRSDARAIAYELFGYDNVALLDFDEVLSKIKINYKASPGVLFQELGLNNKIDSVAALLPIYKRIYLSWCTTNDAKATWPEIWTVSSRPKLNDSMTLAVKARNRQPLGRAISVCSVMEQLLGYPLWKPLMDNIESLFALQLPAICIGINKYGDDWSLLGRILEQCDAVYVGDWSRFDQSIPRWVLERALEVIGHILSIQDGPTQIYWSNYTKYFMANIVDKTYLIDKRYVRRVHSGIPSGSLWTSLIDSVCNYIIIKEVLAMMKVEYHRIFVYGDDHLICLPKCTSKLRKVFKLKFLKIAANVFGMTGSRDDCYMTTGLETRVGYYRPIYKPGDYLRHGTRNLKPLNYEASSQPFTSYDHAHGTTHRWYHDFRRRPKFLSFYWSKDLRPIRPLFETINRIVNPEKKVPSPLEHRVLLFAHLMDNFENQHVRNWLYHMLYDTHHISNGVFNWQTNTIPGDLNLWNDNLYSLMMKTRPYKKGERAWYRRIDSVFDLEYEPCMYTFNCIWRNLLKKLVKAWASVGKQGMQFNTKDIMYEIAMRGALGYDQARTCAINNRDYRAIYSHGNESEELKQSSERTKTVSSSLRDIFIINHIVGSNDFELRIIISSQAYTTQRPFLLSLIRDLYLDRGRTG